MQIVKNHIIQGKHQKPILLDYGYLVNGQAKPVVVFAHGFKGFKDWGHFNKVMEHFITEGFGFVKFNFSHNGGTVEQPIDFPDLEAFGNNNFSKELDDLKTVLDWVSNNDIDEINKEEIYLIGHSRGGGVSVLAANEDYRIKKLVTWAAVADLINRFSQQELDYWKEQGVIYVENTRTNQQMPMYYQIVEDTLKNRERFDIELAANSISIPHLIIHGTDDMAVPVTDAHKLNAWNNKSDLHIINGANHTFGVAHPHHEEQLPDHVVEVLAKTIEFFQK